MNLTDTIVLEFNDGYYEIQHEKTAKDSGKKYLSDKKTFAEILHLKKYLSQYGVDHELTPNVINLVKMESGIKQAKISALAKIRNEKRESK